MPLPKVAIFFPSALICILSVNGLQKIREKRLRVKETPLF